MLSFHLSHGFVSGQCKEINSLRNLVTEWITLEMKLPAAEQRGIKNRHLPRRNRIRRTATGNKTHISRQPKSYRDEVV